MTIFVIIMSQGSQLTKPKKPSIFAMNKDIEALTPVKKPQRFCRKVLLNCLVWFVLYSVAGFVSLSYRVQLFSSFWYV